MGIEVDQYRESIGKYYTVARSVKKCKLLSITDIACFNLLLLYGTKITPLLILVHFFCKAAETRKNTSKVNKSLCCPEIHKLQVKTNNSIFVLKCLNFFIVLCILLIISGIEINPGPFDSDISSSSSSDLDNISAVSELINNTFSFLHLNIQSIVSKIDMISAEYSCHDILSFTESWLNENTSTDQQCLEIPDYKFPPFRRDRSNKVGGGVIVYVKNTVNCTIRPDLHVGSLECIWLEIKLNNKKYLYGTFYIPPTSDLQTWRNIEHSIDLALNCNYDIILTGDFNINQLNNNINDKIGSLMTQFSLHQLITEPTYVTEHSSSLLDLILVSNPLSVLFTDVGAPLLEQVRYHLPVIGLLHHSSKPLTSYKRKIFLYDKGDFDSYRQQLTDVDWETLFGHNDVDTIVDIITNTILNIADNTIPNRFITVHKDSRPWITTSIKKFIRRKNRIHKKAKHTNSINHWEKYRITRNKCNNLIRMAKNDYFSTISEKIIAESSGSKNWWNLVKRLLGSSKNRSIPPLQTDDDLICDNFAKCELINDFFSEQSNLDDSNSTVPEPIDPLYDKLTQLHITETDVEDVLQLLDTTKATGPDLINPRLVREGASILKLPLCLLFNLSLSTCRFPTQWKLANVTPVFKKDNPSKVNNYRPISLISVLGKVMERCIYKHVYNFLLKNSIITPHQSGFTPGDSAINQLLSLTNEFGKALDEGKEIRVVFCDISKAFDRVWHKGLLNKLENIGIQGSLLLWIKNYLTDRKQRVVIESAHSKWRTIKAGVPQGSILGPLFFIIFINDIVTEIHSSIKLFADDTSLYVIVDNPRESAITLNNDMATIHAWSTKWLVNFNPQKTETMTITRKINKPLHPPLIMNNTIINQVTEHKHLGLEISNDGSWQKHIDLIF